jgi:hypothetical protein
MGYGTTTPRRVSMAAIPSISMSHVVGSGTPVEAAVIELASFPKFSCHEPLGTA